MKKTFLAALLCLLVSNLFSQYSRLTLSDNFKIAESEGKNQVVSHSVYHNKNFYTATNSALSGTYKWVFYKLYDVKFSIAISRYDRNMNLQKEQGLENNEKKFGPVFPELILFNNQLYLIYFQPNEKSAIDVFLGMVDDKTLKVTKTQKINSIEQENVGLLKLESVVENLKIKYAISPDNSKLLLISRTSPSTIRTMVLDKDMQILKQTKVVTLSPKAEIHSAVLTNDLLECFTLKSEMENKIVFSAADKKVNEFKMSPVGGLVPENTQVKISRDAKNIYVYSVTKQAGEEEVSCNGMLLYNLDVATLKMSTPSSYPFSQEFVELISNKGGGIKRKKVYRMFTFVPNLMELDNGNIAILGCPEEFFSDVRTSAPNTQGQTHQVASSTMMVGPVIAFYPQKESNQFEYSIIPRSIQISKMSSGSGSAQLVMSPSISYSSSSFNAIMQGNEIVVLYNDSEKNLAKSLDAKIIEAESTKNLVLAEAIFSSDKKLKYRKQIGENMGGKFTYFLGNSVPTNTSSIIFPVSKEGSGFNVAKTIYSNWCFLDIQFPKVAP